MLRPLRSPEVDFSPASVAVSLRQRFQLSHHTSSTAAALFALLGRPLIIKHKVNIDTIVAQLKIFPKKLYLDLGVWNYEDKYFV